jgi:ribosomal quality control pathway NFACT family protein
MAHTPSSPHIQKVRLLTYTLPGGWQVLVGRTDADNDYLSFRVARPEDWWFHVRGMSGSHVILQGPPGADPDRETLQRAAAIAAYHSKARTAGVVAVSGTPVRDVSKPRGAKAGTVQIRNEKVFKVRPARGDLAGEPGHPSASPPHRAGRCPAARCCCWPWPTCTPPWRPTLTGVCAGVGPRVPAWAGTAAARQAGDPPPPPTVR